MSYQGLNSETNSLSISMSNANNEEKMIVDIPQLYQNGSSQNKTHQQVKISPNSFLHIIPDDSDASMKWYDKSDYDRFNHTMRANVASIRSASSNPNFKKLLRHEGELVGELVNGIEKYASREIEHRFRLNRMFHKEAVLNEYNRQVSSGIQDLEALRNVSESNSEWNVAKASIRARVGVQF